jgi:FdhE protein
MTVTAPSSVRAEFERRSARAERLAAEAAAARDPLLFASVLCRAQAQLAAAVEPLSLTGRLGEDAVAMLPLHEDLLRIAADRGPDALAAHALARLDEDPSTAATRLTVYWGGDSEDYLSRALLRPYVEVLRMRNVTPDREHRRGCCPFCGGAPAISTRREASEAAMRFLHCALCGLEWTFNRVCCPSCFEEMPEKLPVYRTEAHRAVRIEACDTCRRYMKSIDLTIDARPIAEIDDLVSLSMDLWAVEEGYTRIEPGLAGM